MSAPWAFSAKKARFFVLDAWVIIPLGICLLKWDWPSMVLAIFSVCVLAFLERRGVSLSAAWPLFKVYLTGPEREAFDESLFRKRCRF